MGICKCKKRSEDFCFNHKKFICDSCVVVDHSICYIKSYVDWLTDCEFEDSVCGVCKGKFDVDDSEDSVRLGCYHLFHPECIDVYVATLSDNSTSSASTYPCPKCTEPILPSPDKQSPLANSIREKFSLSSWAENYLISFKNNNNNNINGNNNNSMNGHSNNNNTMNGYSNLTHTHTNNNNNISPNQSTDSFYNNLDSIKGNNSNNIHSNGININSSLLEETPPLSHLNPNLYARKHEDTIIQLNNNSHLISNNISGKAHDDYDKYNKRPVNFITKTINTIKETKTKNLIIGAVILFVFLILVLRMKPSENGEFINDDNNNNNIVNNNNNIEGNGGNGAVNENDIEKLGEGVAQL